MGKGKVQETMVGLAPPLIYSSSFVVVTSGSFQKFTTTNAGCTCENLWETLLGTSTSLSFSQSYV